MTDATQEEQTGPMVSADGMPLKKSLARSLRNQKMRALALIAPLLIFVLLTFLAPIFDMLFRSVENQMVSDTLPETVAALDDWEAGSPEAPGEPVFRGLYFDLFLAAEAKEHTKLGTRLNYEQVGISSLFRKSGRGLDDVGEVWQDWLEDDVDEIWGDGSFWYDMMSGEPTDNAVLSEARKRLATLTGDSMRGDIGFAPGEAISALLPRTAREYAAWAVFTAIDEEDVVAEEDPWEAVYSAFAYDLSQPGTADAIGSYTGTGAEQLQAVAAQLDTMPPVDFKAAFAAIDEDWMSVENWAAIKVYSSRYTSGYFLNAVDMQLGPDGPEARPDNQQIYMMLFRRTLVMSLAITFSCIALGYPVAWLLANLPARRANLLMILVLLPFWTSLLVRTSAWKVMLQQQGVINDVLVWLGIVADDARLVMINNQFGTIVAMTHILLPFMILPLYSVMQTIPPSYLRAAKSLGATNWTAFWRVYFPQSVPGIGAGSILVFILSIGYYITPELVGGTTGTFISNRIAYHISSSLNWGLAAALGTILLLVVLLLYWVYDRIVGIDNVKLGG